ncbi:MAG: SpoVG family protein [Candidatus Omnitrophica bacterium]|nr:SpoVG family protein [Candidatus Omnitrophota bacterium]MCM8802446.1 SpoVG family protein [Candidatus Omnitrophota bacterium]
MEITEVRVSLVERPNSRLRAYASITFDNSFVVRDVRIIEGKRGLFVAMPSKKMQRPCSRCGFKNPVSHKFCGSCGVSLNPLNQQRLSPSQLHRDLAHPVKTDFREYIQKKVLEEYEKVKKGTGKNYSEQ